MKQVKLQWLQQNVSQTNGDTMNNVRYETRRTFRIKEGISQRTKISELETNCMNENIRDIYRCVN
jgi:hypothetical protein